MRVSLLPEAIPTFLDNRYVTAYGRISLESKVTTIVEGSVMLNNRSWYYLAANPFKEQQSFELILKSSKYGITFSKISLPYRKRPQPPTSINAWWPSYREGEKLSDEYVIHTIAAMLIKAFGRREKPRDGIEVFCYRIDPEIRRVVECRVLIRNRVYSQYPKLLL